MLPRILEPETMDSPLEARDYDAMDHAAVNNLFVADLLKLWHGHGTILDLGTGTAQIPIALCTRHPTVEVLAVDLAEEMLKVAEENVRLASLEKRVRLKKVDAKELPYADQAFDAVMSNSIIHHIPEPRLALAEMIRVTRSGGVLFVRDLLRPPSRAELDQLVETYAAGANAHQQQMFAASLQAALTLEEVQGLVQSLGVDPTQIKQTSDRHWTWATRMGSRVL